MLPCVSAPSTIAVLPSPCRCTAAASPAACAVCVRISPRMYDSVKRLEPTLSLAAAASPQKSVAQIAQIARLARAGHAHHRPGWRRRALRRCKAPTAIINASEIAISIVAAAAMVRLMLSLMPANIWRGSVRCAGPGHQQDDDDFVERRREREHRTRRHARQDQRQHDAAKRRELRSAEAFRGAQQRAVERGKRGQHGDDDERHAQRRMREDEARGSRR